MVILGGEPFIDCTPETYWYGVGGPEGGVGENDSGCVRGEGS